MRTSSILLSAAAALLPVAESAACPPLGPVLPAPLKPSSHEAVQKAIEKLTAGLDAQTSQLLASGLSIGVKSIHEDKQLFSYHFTPNVTSGIGTSKIDENTIYRVGSISKMMPAVTALQNANINFDDSILKYIPELRNATNDDALKAVAWEDITVGSLANHLSGLATDSAMDLGINPLGPWSKMGLPKIAQGTGPSCSGLPGTVACTKADLVRDLAKRPPVYLPNTSPVYSNVGFALLGQVVESATGKPLDEVLQENVYSVAGMNSTSFNGPVKSFSEKGFVPKGEVTWNVTLGVFEAAGGLFSNTVDLIAFGEAILNNKLLSPAKTRKWMHPQAHTSSYGNSVGAPWEIVHGDTLTPDGRLVDVYTKSGDLGLYHALLGLIPDYDVVVSVITAGAEVSLKPTARSEFFSAVISTLLPALSAAGVDQATTAYEGTYADPATNSSLTLSTNLSAAGLVIDSFSARGFDVQRHINLYSLSVNETNLQIPDAQLPSVDGRLVPSNRQKRNPDGSVERAWRAVFETRSDEAKKAQDAALFWPGGSCETWFGLDRAAYNFLSITDFVVVEGCDGKAKVIKNPAFNITLTRV
ncbi:unnamed protein product [Clonostachys solani]|uniref:Beta-lactamase-related domain-containing protein n=1 Tax=Clonostachys solani TaxID=160281 RepID=A0A9P0EQU5_9HYPO|nr:unnamed protein product [Clonostachys solani]